MLEVALGVMFVLATLDRASPARAVPLALTVAALVLTHYWALYLINREFTPGDKLASTTVSSDDIEGQSALTKTGRKSLLINTTEHPLPVNLAESFSGAEASGLQADIVDQNSGEEPPRVERLNGPQITLAPFAVAVIHDAAK